VADFSLELNEDQIQIQKWVHDFAENTVRPVAAEWDEREETPWPVIQEAAKVGLYSLDFVANAWADPTGLLLDFRTPRARAAARAARSAPRWGPNRRSPGTGRPPPLRLRPCR